MNYAKDNHSGDNHPATAKKTKRTARTAQRVYGLDAKTKRCGRNTKGQAKISPCSDASDGFLRTSFLPKLKETKTVQARKRFEKTEEDFYKSLSELARHYNIAPMCTKDFEYPYNLALAISDIEKKLKESVLNCPEIRLLQEGKKIYFISEEKYNTGTTLYYIPIQPLYQMAHSPKVKKNVQLLISVCSYLYHIADIPYYRQKNSYLYWMYEMHKEWAEQDDEEDDSHKNILEFDKAQLMGDYIEKKIFNRINLAVFEKRLKSFKRRNAFDEDCYQTACNAFALYTQYPNENIFRNAPTAENPESDQEENEYISMEKYISFISDTKGWLYENIAQSINNEFNEYTQMDEPTVIKCFDSTAVNTESLDFESRLFTLLDDLCRILYNYETSSL